MVEVSSPPPLQTNREIFEGSFSGAQDRPFIPKLKSDSTSHHPISHSLCEFREQEGTENRERTLYALWKHLPHSSYHGSDTVATRPQLSDTLTLHSGEADTMRKIYDDELLGRCCGGGHMADGRPTHIQWPEFRKYAESKEVELWTIFHDELDLDGNGYLDPEELRIALSKAGIKLSPAGLAEFMTVLTSSPCSHAVDFREFRNFLLLLPRKASPSEIYRYYKCKRSMSDDGLGAAKATMEGDVSLGANNKPPPAPSSWNPTEYTPVDDDGDHPEEDAEEHHDWLQGKTAIKFLLAGGIAGAVSRTCTAPFDRLKVFLITRPPEMGGTALGPKPGVGGIKAIGGAVARIYAEGGVLAFWTGNGLSVLKIFPESAIKFLAYESAKRAFARHRDRVSDPRDISGSSRFLAGGIGGITSQLSIYPIETLKTQMMSSTGDQRRSLVEAMRRLYGLGGIRAYYRGLQIGLVGVFPYSAIDMSTFEALKLAYVRSTGRDEPGVLALLAFGSISGSVGATSVYPLNLVRTRLQASGSSGHPQRYTGVRDVIIKTYQRDGWRGFYRGLCPTLAKVVPSVSISYLVYEHSKRRLGV
ncbi:mitochondrial carrier [Pisolithus orientalis]|uniref:mitochondrial carrier n=1 Tax=Pisolithus orientalis TaxID=936130 RepID=UPI0022259E68|nr:mitochondrial carrier [Pisolithus orientalis]KAI6035174.1 mitochondrial carrier [Pisolithus orientalis]